MNRKTKAGSTTCQLSARKAAVLRQECYHSGMFCPATKQCMHQNICPCNNISSAHSKYTKGVACWILKFNASCKQNVVQASCLQRLSSKIRVFSNDEFTLYQTWQKAHRSKLQMMRPTQGELALPLPQLQAIQTSPNLIAS